MQLWQIRQHDSQELCTADSFCETFSQETFEPRRELAGMTLTFPPHITLLHTLYLYIYILSFFLSFFFLSQFSGYDTSPSNLSHTHFLSFQFFLSLAVMTLTFHSHIFCKHTLYLYILSLFFIGSGYDTYLPPGLGIRSFQKNATFSRSFAFFCVLFKIMKHFRVLLHSL